MTTVLQDVDLLYIKYESQESTNIVTYISNHWMETTKREGVSILLEESEGYVICTLQKKNPEKNI